MRLFFRAALWSAGVIVGALSAAYAALVSAEIADAIIWKARGAKWDAEDAAWDKENPNSFWGKGKG